MVAVSHGERMRTAHALLPLKFTAPPPRAGVLLRQDLQGLLSDVRVNPLTLITAPAGYGKTTLLSQWNQELHRTGAPTCWLSLDSGDRDTAMFLAYLIGSIQTAFPMVGTDAWRILHSAANLDRDWPLVAGSLCSDIQRRVLTAAFLIIDDLHLVVESAVITQILGYLVRAAPPTLHIILSSRRAPSFAPLGRLRAEGRIVEVTQRQLHLTTREVQQILSAQNVALSPDGMRMLLERTEGWALSVQLAARALAAQPPNRREEFVRALGGSQEQLLSYLASEVLADLPHDIIDFLRLAAIPNSFDSDLLAEVLQSEDVNYLLQRARVLGLPILPLDEQGIRMRFHPLWRELLLRSTVSELDDIGLRVLQRRFGQVFESRGDLESAIEHYVAARDTTDLIRALRERAWPLLRTPRRDTVRRWIEQLPLNVREREPDLLHIYGLSMASTDAIAAQQVLRRAVDLYDEARMYEREMRALGDLAAILFWQTRPGENEWLPQRVCMLANRLRDDWSIGASRVCVSAMLFGRGRETGALKVARQAATFPLNPAWRWMLSMLVAGISTKLGRPVEAIAAIDDALGLSSIDLDDRLRQNLLRLKGLALYQQGLVSDGIGLSLEAQQHLSEYDQHIMVAYSAGQLGLLFTLQGRIDESITYLAQARTLYSSFGETVALAQLNVVELYATFLRGHQPMDGDLNGALRRLQDTAGKSPDLRMWLLLAILYGESGNTQRALTLTLDIVRQMQACGYRQYLACAWLYVAYLAGQVGDAALEEESLRAGWGLMVADDHRYLPMLPNAVVSQVARAALLARIEGPTVGYVLRRQIPDQAATVLQELLSDTQPGVRASAARLLGDMSATNAYAALRTLLKDRDATVRQAAEDSLGRLVYRPSYTLRVRTLGSFALWRGDQEVKDRDWRSSKARQLFQILITERGKTMPREWLLETLWPEMDAEAAANNLRVTINRMSKAIEPDRPDGAPSSYLVQQADTYTFNLAADYELDSMAFVTAAEEGREADLNGHRQIAVIAYRRAIGLYGGPYLPDNMYEDWTVVERERLLLLFNETAIRLGNLLLEEGLAHEAIGLGWRVLEHDQAQEDAYRLLMNAHLYLGERSTALRLYNRCVAVLAQDLGVEPLPETAALFQAIREASEGRLPRE